MPRVSTEYNRIYSMSEPFKYWDARNVFQQFYFIEDDTNTHYLYDYLNLLCVLDLTYG